MTRVCVCVCMCVCDVIVVCITFVRTLGCKNLNRSGAVEIFIIISLFVVGKSAGLITERLKVQILAGVVGEFSSPELTLCADSYLRWLLFSVHFTPVLTQWHIKDPSHSGKSTGGRLHPNTHTPVTQQSWSGLAMLQSRHNVGTYPETNSHATCQGTFSHSHLSSLSYCGLILA